MKALKILFFAVLIAAIGIWGYLVYQTYNDNDNQNETTEQCEPVVTMLNDSTFHVNLSDCSCVTLTKNCDTLYIDAIGVSFVHANKGNDTIRIGLLQTYVLNYSDFFDTIKFENIKVIFPSE